MKNINGLLVAAFNVLAFALMVSGCAPAVQIGAGLAGSLAGDTLNSSKQSSENGQPVFIEAHHIGNSTVRVFTQFIAFDRNQDFLKIDAYDQDGKKVGGIMRGNQTQVNKYLKEMNANEKKDYINAQFLEVDIDLRTANGKDSSKSDLSFFETHLFQGFKVYVYNGILFMNLPTYIFQLSDDNGKLINRFITASKADQDQYKSMTDDEKKKYIQRIFKEII